MAVMQQILRYLAGALSNVGRRAGPLVAIKEYIRLKAGGVKKGLPAGVATVFVFEMLRGAPLLQAELTGDLKQLVDVISRPLLPDGSPAKLAPVDPKASSDLYGFGLHPAAITLTLRPKPDGGPVKRSRRGVFPQHPGKRSG